MGIPSTSETTTDGALGSVVATPDNTLLAVGPSSSGQVSGLGAVVQTGSGALVIADNSSVPNANYAVVIKITLAGIVTTSKFQYSLDGGATYNGADITSAATYTIPGTGVSLSFTGTAVLADTYAAAATCVALYPLTQPQDVAGTLASGPNAEFVANVLAHGEGKVLVLACPVRTTAGSIGAVVHLGSGAMTVVNNASASNDRRDVILKITKAGALATSTYQYSLDGGRSYNGKDIATASTITIPGTGIGLTLSGTAVLGDTYAFTAAAPSYTLADLNTALAGALADQRAWGLAAIVGTPADMSTCVAVAAAVDVKMQAAVAMKKWPAAIIEGPDGVDDATVIAAVASVTSSGGKVSLACGNAAITSALTSRTEKRPAMWAAMMRIAKTKIEEHPGRYASGPLSAVGALKSTPSDTTSWSYRDEFLTPGLDDARITTLRTWPGGDTGTYITRGRTLAPVGSDFAQLQDVRVMNKAEQIGYRAILQFANETLRVNKKTGFLDERDAIAIESTCTAKLRAGMGKAAPDVYLQVVRGLNVLATNEIQYRVRLLKNAYGEKLTGEYGFINPAQLLAL